MELYPYQKEVLRLVQQGKNIIIQAPTGAGKTRAALFPYFQMLNDYGGSAESPLPLTCRYAVPMRVLATQFESEFRDCFQKLDRTQGTDYMRRYHERLELSVPAIQTGETPNDPLFESPLTFCTIDQLLASFIGTPYSVSPRQANINVGAVAGSYLILDEFHLYPLEKGGNGARMTALAMLQLLKGISPFVMMTATFSTHLLASLAKLLDAEVVRVTGKDEIATIMNGRARTIRPAPAFMTAEAILSAHAAARDRNAGASLVVCNTVARAQQMYMEIRDELVRQGIRERFSVELLHSRFTQGDRSAKSKKLEDWLGKDRWKDGQFIPTDGKDVIVIGTQVVEVGLNISSGVLHTELAPANSIIQRAGRCARFAGQRGEVIVYPIPPREEMERDTTEGKRKETVSYLPYDKTLCLATWDHVHAIAASAPAGAAFGFAEEQKLIDHVHEKEDRAMIATFDLAAIALQQKIMQNLAEFDRGTASMLIRDVQQVSIVIHPTPETDLTTDPFLWEAFGLHPGTLAGAWEKLEERGSAQHLEWTMRELQSGGDRTNPEEADDDNDRKPVYTWAKLNLAQKSAAYKMVRSALRIALPPELATYDAEIGFRLITDPDAPIPDPLWHSEKHERPKANRRDDIGKQGSYVEHISGLMQAYRFSVHRELEWVANRLEHALNIPAGKIDQAMRLAIACHDIGKLSKSWQRWAHTWQAVLMKKYNQGYAVQPGREWLAKTDRLEWYIERDLRKEMKVARPHHACEGAQASTMFLGARIVDSLTKEQLDGGLALTQAVITAIARHHTPSADSHEAAEWNATAREAVDAALFACDLPPDSAKQIALAPLASGKIAPDYLLAPGSDSRDQILATWLGFVIVRALRLCDQRAERGL